MYMIHGENRKYYEKFSKKFMKTFASAYEDFSTFKKEYYENMEQ